ncbi:MAG: P-loop NTPase fold protein [Bacillota bacterium]
MKANEIVTILNHFKDSSYQRVLIDGTWGIGKTKYVTEFKQELSYACYVSLFGKRDINSIIQEIYYQIIEDVPKGKLKKHFSLFREKLNKFDISYFGVSLSIPVIANIHEAMNKELGRVDTFIIIFDDLERKHQDLDIKEILGLIDSLAKIENIKTVLIAATDQLNEGDKKTFIEYNEKAIDRVYKIGEYAEDAPVEILGEEVWRVISKHTENIEFKNLRTFEKTNLFIREVTEVLGEETFTDKFTKDDIYRMCFATILFKVEHRSQMELLDSKDTKSNFKNAYYTSGEAGVVEYIYNHLLKNSLDNVMSKNAFRHIINWYDTGAFSEEIFYEIASINSYKEKPSNFYSAEQDIVEVIDHCREYIKQLNGDERIEDITSKITTAFPWCELLDIDFGISNEEILDKIKDNISNKIDLGKNLHQNEIDTFLFHTESDNARQLVLSINDAIREEYQKKLIQRIKDCFTENSYKVIYLRDLTDLVRSASSQSIRETLIKSLDENQFFFPIPSGRITEDLWFWCHQVKLLIKEIDQHWEIENYYQDFKDFINSLEVVNEDKLLQHRLKTLFRQ